MGDKSPKDKEKRKKKQNDKNKAKPASTSVITPATKKPASPK